MNPLQTHREIPSLGMLDSMRAILAAGGGRVDMGSTLEAMHTRHGEVVRQHGGIVRIVNIFGPDDNRMVLLDREGIFSARKPWMQIMGHVFPNGLLLRDGADHRHHRKLMREAFKRPVLHTYLDRMNPMIQAGLDGWAAEPGRRSMYPALKALTLDVAAAIFIGGDLGGKAPAMNRAFEDMVAASMSRVRLPIPGLEYTRGLAGRRWMLDFLRGLLPEKRSQGGEDMFARLCWARGEQEAFLGDQEVVDHMVFLMMAAHDTTTSTLCSMAYLLARHPHWQERLREESLALPAGPADMDSLAHLESLDLVFREALRLYPPLPVIPRVATRSFGFKGYEIRENTMVVISPIHTHRMPAWWSEPARFDPERFAAPRLEDQRHTHSFVPFGGGTHICLGRRFAETQVRAVLHQMLQRFRWSVPDGYRMPVQQAPISKPRDGLPVQITPLKG